MTSKTIAERDRCIAEALLLKDSPGAGVGRRAAGLPAREDRALGNGSGAVLGANVPEPSLDALFRAPNHHAGIKRQNHVSARASTSGRARRTTVPDDTRRALPTPVTPGMANSGCGRFLAELGACHANRRSPSREMRESGVFGVVVFCSNYQCSHSVAPPADRWSDDVRLSDIEPQFVCKLCGKCADVRPNFQHAAMGTG